MKSAILVGLIFIEFAVGVLYPNHFLLAGIALIFIGINVYTFNKDKRELNKAIYYVRTRIDRMKSIKVTVHAFAFIFIIVYLILFIPEQILKQGVTLYLQIMMLSIVLGNYYERFRSSIRSFNFGIVVPEGKSKKIEWTSISHLEIKEDKMTIGIINGDDYVFEFDKRDFDEALRIKNQFELIQ